jgi:hypothetical protein
MKQYYDKEEVAEIKQKTIAITVFIAIFMIPLCFALVGIINFLFNPDVHTTFVRVDGYEDIYYDSETNYVYQINDKHITPYGSSSGATGFWDGENIVYIMEDM